MISRNQTYIKMGEKVVQLILYSVSLSNTIVYDNNGSKAGRKRASLILHSVSYCGIFTQAEMTEKSD